MNKLSIAIIGAGKVGSALGILLQQKGTLWQQWPAVPKNQPSS